LRCDDPSLTAYLDTVCVRVQPLAPEAWVADLRAELACHLECTADAYEELGDCREQAMVNACRSLGDPVKLGRQWERFWQEKVREPLRKTALRAIGYFSVAMLLHAVAVFGFGDYLFSPRCLLDPAITNALLLPLLTGVCIVRRARGRRMLETALVTAGAVLAEAAVTAVLDWTLPGEDLHGMRTLLWVTAITFWLPLGTAAAGVTRLVSLSRSRRRCKVAGEYARPVEQAASPRQRRTL
jgi:hypothetical protein